MKIQIKEQIRATRKLMGLLNEQEEGRITLEERFAPLKGQEFTGVGIFTNHMGAQFEAKSSAITQILKKIGGHREGRVKDSMLTIWDDGTEETFNILDYIQEIGYPGDLEYIWVKKECGDPTLCQEVEPPAKWKVGKWKKFEKTHRREEKSTRRFKVI